MYTPMTNGMVQMMHTSRGKLMCSSKSTLEPAVTQMVEYGISLSEYENRHSATRYAG